MMDLAVGKLYRVNEGGHAGRKYRIDRFSGEEVWATEGWWKYQTFPDRASPQDSWEWSPNGSRAYPRTHFESVQSLGDPPQDGDPRFRYRWGRD